MPLFLVFVSFMMSSAQPTHLQQGLVALRDGKLQEARMDLEKAVAEEPQNPVAWVSLAETDRRLADKPAADQAAEKAAEFGVHIAAVNHALASFYAAEEQFGTAASFEEKYAGSPQADSQATLRTAELYQRAGDKVNAERVSKQAWERQETDPLVAFSYAQLLLRKLDFAGAERVVQPALTAHPQDPQLMLSLGVIQYGERRFGEAIDDFLRVIQHDPSIPQPYDFLGKMLEQAGDKLPAIQQAVSARCQAAPDDAAAALDLAKIRLLSNPKDPQAEELLRRSLVNDPSSWEAHYELGLVLESKHEYAAAITELKRSAELDSKQPMPHYHLARVYDRLGEKEQAAAERKRHEALSNLPN